MTVDVDPCLPPSNTTLVSGIANDPGLLTNPLLTPTSGTADELVKREPDSKSRRQKWRRFLRRTNIFLTGTNPASVSKYLEFTCHFLTATTLFAATFGWPKLPIVEAIDRWRAR